MKIITRAHFGLKPDCWHTPLPTADTIRVETMLNAACNIQAFVAILGPRGSGKSHSVQAALAQHDVQIVEPLRLTRDKLHMGDIENALIRELSDRSPKQSGERRSFQVKRILGAASRQQAVVLVIDDSHVLHGNTLRSLKRLRELSWMGQSPLLGIVLIGQKDKTQNIAEVHLRSDRLWLAGLTPAEATHALHNAMGAAFTGKAITALATSQNNHNWLDLQYAADQCMAYAQAQGLNRVDVAHVKAVLNPNSRPKAQVTPPVASDASIAHLLGSKSAPGRVQHVG